MEVSLGWFWSLVYDQRLTHTTERRMPFCRVTIWGWSFDLKFISICWAYNTHYQILSIHYVIPPRLSRWFLPHEDMMILNLMMVVWYFGATLTRPRSGSSLRGLESIYHNILPLILTFILMSSCCVDRQGIYYLPLGRSRDAHLNVLFRCSAHWNWYGYRVGEPSENVGELTYVRTQ